MSSEVSVSRLFLRALLPLFEFLEKLFGQLRVDVMSRTCGNDVRLERQAEQHDIANDIEDLVADEFVLKAQAFFRKDLVAADDDGAVEAAAFDFAHLHQFFDVFVNRERAGSGDLRHVRVRIDVEREMLRVNTAVVSRRAGDTQRVARQSDDRAVAVGNGNGLIEDKIFALFILLHRIPLNDHVDEGLGRSVKNRRLARVELDQGVVDATAVQRA